MKAIKLQVITKSQKYPIIIGNNILSKIKKIFKDNFINFNQCLVIADKNVPKRLINKVYNSLSKKKLQFFTLAQVKKIKIKKALIKSYLFF